MKPANFKKDPRYKQGIYVPIHGNKFIGDTAIYRSGLELKFMKFCDTNPNIIRWGSENVVIPYRSPVDNKMHRYYVDNFVTIKEGDRIKNYLIEVKPSKQIVPPTAKYRKKSNMIYEQVQWTINQAKWAACKEHCVKRGFEFIILTEKELQ